MALAEAKKKIKILVVIPDLNVESGVAAHVMNYYTKIHNEFDIDFAVYTKTDNKYTREICNNGDGLIFFEKNMLKSHKSIKDFFRKHAVEYDIIHCHTFNYGFLYLYFAKKYGIKNRIMHIHSIKYSDSSMKAFINTFMVKLCTLVANVYVACSGRVGRKAYHNKPFYVINNGIDLAKFSDRKRDEVRSSLGITQNDFLFGNVGRLTKGKNQIFAINVFAELRKVKRFKKSKMIIVGKGPLYKDLLMQVENIGLKNEIIFVQSADNIPDYYAAMDCFIFPSKYEGLGMAAIEAQASGLPCFCNHSLPEEIFATELIYGLDLKSGEREWSDAIVKSSLDRKDVAQQLMDAGFEIKQEKDKLIGFYESFCMEGKKCV